MTSAPPPRKSGVGNGLAPRLVGLAVLAVCGVALVSGAFHGARTAARYDDASASTASRHDTAYYTCVDRQVHSVVRPGELVTLPTTNFENFVTLLRSSGSWLAFAPRPSEARLSLSLEDTSGKGTCSGTLVVATTITGPGRGTVVAGHGSSLPGHGFPPLPPL
ncbi:MAG TPA: hypothetical protein VEJ87_14055 [Acidimicrobiales bacterium]|nr:hypothetical protein [Acidimicrobiales bacterium]